jgi:hypothetical protein
MTFAEMQVRVEALCKVEGWSDAPTPPDFGALINRALAMMSAEGQYVTAEHSFSTTIGTAEYSLLGADTRDWASVSGVIYGTSALTKANPTEQALESPTWWRDTSGTPIWWWLSRPNMVRLHPIPSAIGTVYVIGYRVETELVDASDTPVLYADAHDALCRLAAALLGEEYATTAEQMGKIERWTQSAIAAAETVRGRLYGQRSDTWQRRQQSAPVYRSTL